MQYLLHIQTAQDDDFTIYFIYLIYIICSIFKLLRMTTLPFASYLHFSICCIFKLLRMTTLPFASYLSAAYSNCSIRERDEPPLDQQASHVPLGTLPHATRVNKKPYSKQSLGAAKRYYIAYRSNLPSRHYDFVFPYA